MWFSSLEEAEKLNWEYFELQEEEGDEEEDEEFDSS